MRVTVHLVEVRLWMPFDAVETPPVRWTEYRFEPSEASHVVRESGARVERSQSRPVAIEAPPLGRLERVELPRNGTVTPAVPPEPLRLVAHGYRSGLDAGTVHHLAERGQGGFRFATPPVPAAELSTATPVPLLPETDNKPDPIPLDHLPSGLHVVVSLAGMGLPHPVYEALEKAGYRTPEKLAEWINSGAPPIGPHMASWGEGFLSWAAKLVREALVRPDTTEPRLNAAVGVTARWGIAFASRTYHGRTFLHASSVTPTGPVASTRDLKAVASWSDPVQAEGWMKGRGWDPSRPVSPGLDYLYPSVAEIPAELPGHGIEFELTRAVAPLPAAQLPASNPAPDPVSKPVSKPKGRSRASTGQAAFAFD